MQYKMGDMYRADASAGVDLTRLARDEEAGYLLEMEVTERIMIHGGVDLTAVRRVRTAQGQERTRKDGVLEALDRDVRRGQVQAVLRGDGDKEFRVFGMATAEDEDM